MHRDHQNILAPCETNSLLRADQAASRPRLGVLGGMGALATAVFYQRLVKASEPFVSSDQEHIDTLIWSDCAIPDRTECIKSGITTELFKHVKEAFKLFEAAACNYICFPCNTLHYFYEDLQSFTDIPLLNMIDLSFKALSQMEPSIKTVRVFATDGTIASGTYGQYAKRYGIEIIPNEPELQQEVMRSIYELKETGRTEFPLLSAQIEDLVKAPQIQVHKQKNSSEKESASKTFSKKIDKADKLILACTELSCMRFSPNARIRVFDAMDALIQECVRCMLKTS